MTGLSRQFNRRSGMVLVIAVGALAVMMLLLLALFEGASHQIRGAQSDAALAREKLLADSAVALVMGQIQKASTQTGQAWISQPGLLRTYGPTATRTPTACYKLYSTSSLISEIDTTGNLNFFGSDVPANWNMLTSQYTDLNTPVQTVGGSILYPILDLNALTNSQNQAAGTQVEGVSSDTGAVTMPVAWLYQLQDGTLGPAGNGTAANPIVARMAFWTDDDTCKININTAGCGSPWNTPRVNSTADVTWSTTQPADGEFSAYPGHPATTSLGALFGSGASALSPQQLLGLTPRYAWGGSQFGAQATTPGEVVATKTDRLYASLDELSFAPTLSATGQRQANPVSADQLEMARFALTAHSQAPETTLLGEPRVAIWPVTDSATKLTATDRAIISAATVGMGTANARGYYFQRNDPLNPKDDFDPATPSIAGASNLQLFNDLAVTRGNLTLPGYGAPLAAKFPGANWTQLMLEITDFIRGLNAVDPSPAPFTPFAPGNAAGVGRAFVDPLTMTSGSGPSAVTLRGLGRCPTLSSLTLVLYVCGFQFDSHAAIPSIDYETTPDLDGSNWATNLAPSSPLWSHVTAELVRAFVVPCTFQPGCGYPEVSDNCSLQITGLNGIGLTSATSNDFLFSSGPLTSHVLNDALSVLPAERAWGGNEGPLAWRAAAVDAQQAGPFSYAFAGTKAFPVRLTAKPTYSPATGLVWPTTMPTLVFHGAPNLTVVIRDGNGATLQTLDVNFPANVGVPAPTPIGEYSLKDGSAAPVMPSYYMTLKNRVLATQASRPFFIQPGDTSRSMEAATDLRVIAGLENVPSTLFQPHPSYRRSSVAHAHNLHFADGTAVYGASGPTNLISAAGYAATTTTLTWTSWQNGSTLTYAWPTSPPCSCPTGPPNFVTMMPVQNIVGDWDTGPGFSPDGAQVNLPDAGTTVSPATAYFSLSGGKVGAATQRSPNALVPSPVIFGSLPAGINPAQPAQSEPWRTLLFCPYPAADAAHPGFGSASAASPVVPDHLILDNFWMPVVEPYPISTCMATAGKINLNDQIAPFTYLHRNTAFHALLNTLRIPAIPVAAAGGYKAARTPLPSIWNSVDENATIAQIENRFAGTGADAYLCESEICTVPLVPDVQPSLAGADVAATQLALDGYWNGPTNPPGGLTGDNLRELPYAQLYGRLTTRSNSYTVHVRVQVLQKLPHDPNQNVWNEGVDLVQGDWRGSYEIERYLDPAATAPVAGRPLGPYKFRIVSLRQFAP